MSGEQQLERSVLDGKERDELLAIAEAMGLKPAARVAKATLVNQILKATGVEVADEPKRARSRAKSTNGDAPATPAADAAGETEGGLAAPVAPVAKGAETEAQSTNGNDASNQPVSAESAPTRVSDDERDERDVDDAVERDERAGRSEVDLGRDQASPPIARDRGQQGVGNRSGPTGHGAQSNQGFDQNDTGNRRNRRRRGRDRERVPGERGERDLPGMGQEQQYQGEPVPVQGLLDLRDEGFGFLRTSGFLPSTRDVYVSISQVRRFALRKGDYIEGASRPAGNNEKYPALLRIDTVSGLTPDEARQRPRFEDLTPLFPDGKLRLEIPGDSANMTARIVDLISPIGKGQRGLIVSPPKAGKTTVLKQIAHSIEANNPDVYLMVLLVDERPEEVTDMRRSVKGEVVASTFDRPSEEHTQVAELAIERAKRMVEVGKDVVIVLDGITRLSRAYNLAQPATGRIMSGGIDTGALYPPKKFFGAARNIEEGGSLTILATALVETGSRMDEVIFEEFKGTGNMELRLDRKLAERRIYPAIDVNGSSTRHEELLFDRTQLQQVWKLRRVLNALASDGSAAAGLELLMDKIKHTKSNDEFLAEIAKGPNPAV